ncbi:MAG: hypothetical protein E7643_04540 [Ruminococcaceae bacterium]|nr:hypothetical protein [Oscillospiraceae bacterium]
MFLIDWWNAMDIASRVFACMAVPATLILLIQTLLLFLGFDGDDAPDDLPDDLPDTEALDGIYGEELPNVAPDHAGFSGLRIFTMRGIVAFFVVFGWVGLCMNGAGVHLGITIPVAFLCGAAMMLALALLFRALLRLRTDGNTDNKNAIGTAGRVQLTIPPARSGEGKVHVMLQGAYVERDAVTDDSEAIPTGSEIVVVGVSGLTTLVVRRK